MTVKKNNFPDGNFCKIQSGEQWFAKSDLQNLQLAKKHSSQLAVLSNFPFLTLLKKCAWSRHLPVCHNMNTSMAVTTGKVSFDEKKLKVWTAWCSFVHHGHSCWLVCVAVPAWLTHCYENMQASHSEHVYIWLTGWSWTIILSQT